MPSDSRLLALTLLLAACPQACHAIFPLGLPPGDGGTADVGGTTDSGTADNGTLDRSSADTLSLPTSVVRPFGAPTPLGAGVNSPKHESDPCLSPDEKELFFARGGEIWRSARPTDEGAFPTATPVAELNEVYESGPTLSYDARTIYFHSTRLQVLQDTDDLWSASRPHAGATFDTPKRLEAPNTTDSREVDPTVSGDGLTLIFSSNRPGGMGKYDLWVSTRSSSNQPFPSATPLAQVNSSDQEWEPDLTADGLHLYFSSDRPGGKGDTDIWRADRSSPTGKFSAPVNVTEVNSPYQEDGPAISPDGRRLLFISNRPTGTNRDIWKAEAK
jgi:Tol biopolymer transport system component